MKRLSSFVVCFLLVVLPFVVVAQEQTCTVDDDGATNCVNPSSSAEEEEEHVWLHDPEFYLDDEGRSMSHASYDKLVSMAWGESQRVVGVHAVTTMKYIDRMELYMEETVLKDPNFSLVESECRVRNELCAFWAAIGECEKNPGYMKLQCAPVCQSCEQLSFETRCPYDKNAEGAWQPGDLNKMFERITTDEYYQQFSPQILLQPPDGPWVVVLDDFVSPEECDRLIESGAKKGYEISKDVGKRKFDGTYDGAESKDRTSTNAWCVDECFNDTATQSLLARQANLTGIPDPNNEYLQLLRYEEGQFYGEHHDYINHHNDRAQGVRILTVFYYLNDVEEGGGTHFSKLKITVQPKKGRALLWPSVLDDRPNKKDHRTNHEALPVIKGIKYAANSWVHQRDFKETHKAGCT